MALKKYAFDKTVLDAIALDLTFDKANYDWSLIGFEINFTAATYTGTVSFTKVVADTAKEVDKEYRTKEYTGVADIDQFGKVFDAAKNDTMTITTSAAYTGTVSVKLYIDELNPGTGGEYS